MECIRWIMRKLCYKCEGVFMKCMKVLVVIFVLLMNGQSVQAVTQNHIVVVIASYNNAPWYKRNLDSLFWQKYNNWHAIYIDDCSTDGTYEGVSSYVQQCGMQDKVTIVRNKER